MEKRGWVSALQLLSEVVSRGGVTFVFYYHCLLNLIHVDVLNRNVSCFNTQICSLVNSAN